MTKISFFAECERLLGKDWVFRGTTYNLRKRGWTFGLSTSKKAIGTCHTGSKKIVISKAFIATNEEKLDVLLDTMRHEIAHAIDFEFRGTVDHGRIWKEISNTVTFSRPYATRNNLNPAVVVGETKYTVTCPNCKSQFAQIRKRKRNGACKKCCDLHNNGYYSAEFAFKITQNY